MMMAAFAEAGLSIADADNPKHAHQYADELVSDFMTLLSKR